MSNAPPDSRLMSRARRVTPARSAETSNGEVEVEALTTLAFDDYTGSALRGGLVTALQRNFCPAHDQGDAGAVDVIDPGEIEHYAVRADLFCPGISGI